MSIILKVDNNVTYIQGKLDSDIYKELKKELGYLPEGSFWMIKKNSENNKQKWKQEWDGYITTVCWNKKFCRCHIKKSGTHFQSGLLSKACNFFKNNDISYKIIDIRKKTDKTDNYSMSKEFESRDYQVEVIDKITKGKGIDRGIIKMATGSGKCPVACAIITGIGVTPVIFYVPSISLLKQSKDEIERFVRYNNIPVKVGMVGGGVKDIQDITVMTIQTAVRALGGVWVKFDDEDINKDDMDISDIKDKIVGLIQNCRLMCLDECQHASAETCQIISDSSISCQYRFGFSVFPESIIELRGKCFNQGENYTIEEAWNKIFEQNKGVYYKQNGYEIIDVDGIESRGWEKDNFIWKGIKKIIRHVYNKNGFSVRFAGSEKINMTKDHSVFKIQNNNIIDCTPNDLKKGDCLLIDDGNKFESKQKILTALDILSLNPKKMRVALDLSKINKEQIHLTQDRYYHLTNRGRMAKKYGGSLYLKQYLKFKDILPAPKWVYVEGGNNTGISPDLKIEDISYLVGFYIGDGWIDKSRINFAVEKSFLECFLKYFNSINKIKINPGIRKAYGKSYEVRCSCYPFADFMNFYFEGKKCFDKRIPNNLLFNKEEIRREVLEGLIDSDGSRGINQKNIKLKIRPYCYTTTSYGLKNDVCLLLRSLNVSYLVAKRKPSLGGIIDGRQIIGRRISYQINWSGNSLDGNNKGKCGNVKRTNINCIEKKVLEISKIDKKKNRYVYDLEMEGHPSFVVNGVLVHNSATPHRDLGDDILIDACFGKTIVDINASCLIKKGYLVKPHIYFCKINNMRGKVGEKTYQTIYKEAIVYNDVRNQKIVDFANYFNETGRKTLVLIKQIAHGKLLEEMIPGSVFIYGNTPKKEREKHLEKMRNGWQGVTIASVVFDEGINCKPLDTLILAGSGKSSSRALQRIGRILRPYPGKKDAIVVDFLDNCKYLLSHSRKREKIYKSEEEFVIERPK